ncbi:hypothetical protein LINGRAHAP2_LOCUS23543 [Linum grandiflorum]
MMGHSGNDLEHEKGSGAALGAIRGMVHDLRHNFSLGSPNGARLTALESSWNSLQLS